MACNANMLNLAIIVILIFIIFAMLYKKNIYMEPFHAPYDGNVGNIGKINNNSEIIKKDSLFDMFKNFISRIMKVS